MTGRLLVERQEMLSERVLSPRAIEVDLLRAVRTNRLKERLIARQWFQTGLSIPEPSLFQATLRQARREFTTSGISRPFFPIAIFSPIAPCRLSIT